jgi:hypothetical protein
MEYRGVRLARVSDSVGKYVNKFYIIVTTEVKYILGSLEYHAAEKTAPEEIKYCCLLTPH